MDIRSPNNPHCQPPSPRDSRLRQPEEPPPPPTGPSGCGMVPLGQDLLTTCSMVGAPGRHRLCSHFDSFPYLGPKEDANTLITGGWSGTGRPKGLECSWLCKCRSCRSCLRWQGVTPAGTTLHLCGAPCTRCVQVQTFCPVPFAQAIPCPWEMGKRRETCRRKEDGGLG